MASSPYAAVSALLAFLGLSACAADVPHDVAEAEGAEQEQGLGELSSALVPTYQRGQLIAQNSAKCMTVYKASRNEGAAIIQYTCLANPSFNQVVTLWPTQAPGYYRVVFGDPASGDPFQSCLRKGIIGYEYPHNVVVQDSCRHEDTRQWWIPIEYPDGTFALRAMDSTHCATVHRGLSDNELRIITYQCNDKPNQKWRFRPLP